MINLKTLAEKTSERTIHLLFYGHDPANCFSRGRRLFSEDVELKESQIKQLAMFTGLSLDEVFTNAWERPTWVFSKNKVNTKWVAKHELGTVYLENRILALERYEGRKMRAKAKAV